MALSVLLACDDSTAFDRLALGDVEPDGAATEAPEAEAPDTAAERRPARIYYDLTVFDWYRHGEPLRVGSREFLPHDKPLALPADRLRRAGSYGEVDFYVRPGDQPPYDSLFVPVFSGYWQRFLALDAGQPLHAD